MIPSPFTFSPGEQVWLSIIIPLYNEASRVERTLFRVETFFSRLTSSFEIIVVDDGSLDDTGLMLARVAAERPRVRVLRHSRNRGKGAAVRSGMLAARGQLALFTDADLSTFLSTFDSLLRAVEAGHEVAMASRAHPESRLLWRQSKVRELSGLLGNFIIRALLPPLRPFRDTQCGFKLYTREAVNRIFPHQRVEGWGFDFEALYIARRMRLSVAEVPCRWSHLPGSKVKARDYLATVLELGRVWYTSLRGAYGPFPG